MRVMKKMLLRIGQSHAKEASVCHQVCDCRLQSLEKRLCWGMRVLRAVDILEEVDAWDTRRVQEAEYIDVVSREAMMHFCESRNCLLCNQGSILHAPSVAEGPAADMGNLYRG